MGYHAAMDSSLYFGGAIVLGAFLWFFCAYLCYVTAGQKHRRPVTWLILGIIFGPIAFAVLYMMPKGNLAPAHNASTSAAQGSTGQGTTAAATSAHEHGSEHDAEHAGTKTQADLYEVPHKHKH
jgi:uncharacterized membrane protein YedE/YeeE